MSIFRLNLSDGEVIKYYKVRARTTTGIQVNTLVYAFSPEEVLKKFHKVEEIEGVAFEGPRDYIPIHLHELACQVEVCLKSIAQIAEDSIHEDSINDMKDLLSIAKEKLQKINELVDIIEHELYREESLQAQEQEEKRFKLQLEIARLKRELRELQKEKEERELKQEK